MVIHPSAKRNAVCWAANSKHHTFTDEQSDNGEATENCVDRKWVNIGGLFSSAHWFQGGHLTKLTSCIQPQMSMKLGVFFPDFSVCWRSERKGTEVLDLCSASPECQLPWKD